MTATMQFRPLLVGKEYDDKAVWKRINWTWVLQRLPMLLFALVSSYGVGHLLSLSGVKPPFDTIGSISFDLGFLGAIALADMQLTKSTWNQVAYFALNIGMSGLAALFNVLSHADGKYANITAESITVGAPFAVVGLLYALYYHSVMNGLIDKETEQKDKNDKAAAKTAFPCDYCGEGKGSRAAVYGHFKSCAMKQMHVANPNPAICKCLQCHPKT